MEEKKNGNQVTELKDEELEQVAGGYTYKGPMLKCSKCPNLFYPESEQQEKNIMCPKCERHYTLMSRRILKNG